MAREVKARGLGQEVYFGTPSVDHRKMEKQRAKKTRLRCWAWMLSISGVAHPGEAQLLAAQTLQSPRQSLAHFFNDFTFANSLFPGWFVLSVQLRKFICLCHFSLFLPLSFPS